MKYFYVLKATDADLDSITKICERIIVHADRATRAERDNWSIRLDNYSIGVGFQKKDDHRAFERAFKRHEWEAIQKASYEYRMEQAERQRMKLRYGF